MMQKCTGKTTMTHTDRHDQQERLDIAGSHLKKQQQNPNTHGVHNDGDKNRLNAERDVCT
jgi:hypothetical protein